MRVETNLVITTPCNVEYGGRGDRPFGSQPDGGGTDAEGAPPEIPDGAPISGGGPGMQNGIGGGSRGDDGRFTQWEQNRDGPQDSAATGAPAVSPAALALVGVSILSLLAGIGIALKIKH